MNTWPHIADWWWLALGPVAIAAGAAAWAVRARRQEQQRRLLTWLGQAVRANLPLVDVLAAARAERSARTQRKLARIERVLRDGGSLAAALDRWPQVITARSRALVAVGERTGRLDAALDRLTAAGQSELEQTTGERAADVGYAVALLAVAAAAVVLLLRIDPAGLAPVVLDRIVIGAAVVACTALGAVALMWVAGRLGLAWSDRLPVVGRLRRDRALADVLTAAADGLEAGLDLPTAALEAAAAATHRPTRRRMQRWAGTMREGQAPADAARRAGLGGLISGMLGAARSPAAVHHALGYLATYYHERSLRVVAWLRAALVPIVVLLSASVVAAVALAMMHGYMDVLRDAAAGLSGGRAL